MAELREFRELMPLEYTLSESKGNGVIYLQGKYQQCDQKNENGRIYPRKLWEKALGSSKVKDRIEKRGMYGELEHPCDGMTKFSRVSHIVIGLDLGNNGEVIGKSEVLPTPNGEILRVLGERHTLIGVSSRGRGVSEMVDGAEVVDEDFELDTFDFVCSPSTLEAYATPKYESLLKYSPPDRSCQELIEITASMSRLTEKIHQGIKKGQRDRVRSVLRTTEKRLSELRNEDRSLTRICDAVYNMIEEARIFMADKEDSVPVEVVSKLIKGITEQQDTDGNPKVSTPDDEKEKKEQDNPDEKEPDEDIPSEEELDDEEDDKTSSEIESLIKRQRLRKNEGDESDIPSEDELDDEEDGGEDDDSDIPSEDELDAEENGDAKDESDIPSEDELDAEEDGDAKDKSDIPSEDELDDEEDAPPSEDKKELESLSRPQLIRKLRHSSQFSEALYARCKELKKANKKLSSRYESSLGLIDDIVKRVDETSKKDMIEDAIKRDAGLEKVRSILEGARSVKELQNLLSSIRMEKKTESSGFISEEFSVEKRRENGLSFEEIAESGRKQDPQIKILKSIQRNLGWK